MELQDADLKVVPDIHVFRRYVDKIYDVESRRLVQVLYLLAARVSEVTTVVTPYDQQHRKSKPYGKLMRWRIEDYKSADVAVKVLILQSAIAKRKEKKKEVTATKTIALPLDLQYEPWSLELLKMIQHTGSVTFPHDRTWAWQKVKRCMLELDPAIHPHSFRHYRLTHLTEFYGFEKDDRHIYAGWKYGTMDDVYTHLSWHKYFPKLLKPLYGAA